MSLDGSFVCHSSLRRLLARCPLLQSNPKLNALSLKGAELTADDVVGAIAEPFLHPTYTMPIVGCFRPLIRRIVDKAVALLHLVPGLGTNSGEDCAAEIGEDDIQVVEFYVGRGKGLRLHEVACLALCRALDLAPFLLGSVLNYFNFAPPPFERFSTLAYPLKLSQPEAKFSIGAIHVSFRYLMIEYNVFSKLWNWSCLLDLLQNSADACSDGTSVSSNDVLDIRWCVIQILSKILRMNDRATRSFGLQEDEALACYFRWEEFCQDTALEKAGFYLQSNEGETVGYSDEIANTGQRTSDTQSSFVFFPSSLQLESRQRNQSLSSCGANSDGSSFVLTSALRKSYEMVVMAVSQKWPVLLHGPSGVGKTSLINKLSLDQGSQVLFIHMDEQMDSKTLIGSYICAEQPGQFKWQPGSLTQAVLKGFWLVFEDIDKAPAEVQSILLPLLEGSNSFPTGHGEAVNVSENFRLFATVSSSKHDVLRGREGKFTLSVLWKKIMVGISSSEDMVDIVNARYPCLVPYTLKLIETFEKVNSVSLSGNFNRFSLRHLLKWCKRIAGLGCAFSGIELSALDCRNIYREAVDIFASSSASSGNRLLIMREIANIWNIPVTETVTLYPPDKPTVQSLRSTLRIGRVMLDCTKEYMPHKSRPFVNLHSSLHVLEKIACAVKYNEPILLVGETGTGKTTLVQNLAMRLGQPLTILNLSQQSDVADLLGGFKPSDARSICMPLHHEFKELFSKTFPIKGNESRLNQYDVYAMEKKWKKLLHALRKCVVDVLKSLHEVTESGRGRKRKRPLSEAVVESWQSFSARLETAWNHISGSSRMSFSFVEGAFINALRNGHWILLDEVNLAPPETLQRIIGVLDGENGTLCLAERGDVGYVDRHSCFRLFACMNPANDAGKRDLPHSFRSRFTEYFVDDILDDEDLCLFVSRYMDDTCSNGEMIRRIVHFYKAAKHESEARLQDGANQKPQFSLRSLARALEFTKKAEKEFGFQRALYDGFCMFFRSLLDGPSCKIMNNMILSHLLGGNMPPNVPFDGYFTDRSSFKEVSAVDGLMENYVLTRSVKEHLRNIARAVYIKRYPVLLQGPTSSGKTSLVQYLASVTGHEFVRINNHDHTDLQEYFGSYTSNSFGKLEFQEGALVKAVRMGYWIVLDELNLAPSDVLEALNRLLDDNRELFIPELQEMVAAHPEFMLFATQNPPTLYGGRKMLSRAFRNRFLEIHVDEIPEDELSTILERRCKVPHSYATKMVEVLKDLQLHRQNSKVFAGKHGFITPRDLFRWANRFHMFGKSYEDLARDGYLLLAERLREESEKNVVQEALEQRLRVKLLIDNLYNQEPAGQVSPFDTHKQATVLGNPGNIIWTKSMWRLFFLVERCYKMREPVLLVGETGGGKTTACQLLSLVLGLKLHTLNCHQYTESSDFLGGFHPVRDRSKLMLEFKQLIEKLKLTKFSLYFASDLDISSDIEHASSTLSYLGDLMKRKPGSNFYSSVTEQDLCDFETIKGDLTLLQQKWQMLFLWQDGPLVQAMKEGNLFLLDEISLADDSVLERLNSVLEPERTLLMLQLCILPSIELLLTGIFPSVFDCKPIEKDFKSLAEKGGSVLEKVTAHPNFFILATMNPGGDYGKKELSPALRNRFTEIWVPPVLDLDELKTIAAERFTRSELSCFVNPMLKFWEWFNQMQRGRMLTVRDLLSWISFINVTEKSLGSSSAVIHGAFLVLLDGLSLGTGISKVDAGKLRMTCFLFLLEQLKAANIGLVDSDLLKIETYGWGDAGNCSHSDCFSNIPSHLFGIKPFYVTKGSVDCKQEGFEFLAPTTHRNALRVLRAMQLAKPVLLEGSPGVGKTSLVVALASYSGHSVVRINLSEQTDMMDLLGSDLPVNSGNQIKFAWSDGILLQAIKNGSWVLFDELNLAPQSVLEGLNAILDHRAEVYIPELGLTFKCPPSFRVFACQNPSSQGGGRKGLPKSFLNRFTKVFVDELATDDYLFICRSLFPSIPMTLLSKLIIFNNRVYEDTMLFQKYGQVGSPWEFNLRDVIRSCQIIEGEPEKTKHESFLHVVYAQRMRTAADRRKILESYEEVFGVKPLLDLTPKIHINSQYLAVGSISVARNHFQPTRISKSQVNMSLLNSHTLEAILYCIRHQWLCILVGPSSSGKTSMIRFLADITGNSLNELNLSSGTDVSELLGCFEQYNVFHSFKSVVIKVERYVNEYFSLRLDLSWEDLLNERKDLIARWLSFLKSIDCTTTSFSEFTSNWKDRSCMPVQQLAEIIQQLMLDLKKYHLPVSWSREDLAKSLKIVLDLQKNNGVQQMTKFEWVAGGLIKAIEHGEWVVLDNANLCNPTVLDRINSLVEPSGLITVNECGLVDGKPLVLHAHPNFRMFLTVDPRYGEVSRAMRNRGVELFMMERCVLLEEESNPNCIEHRIDDLKRFLVFSGIPLCRLIDAMAQAHIYAKDAGLHHGVDITLLELTCWVQLFQQLLMCGNQPTWSLQLSWEHTYLSSLGEIAERDIIAHVKHMYLCEDEWFKLDSLQESSLALPGGWPAPLNTRYFLCFSQESSIKQNCAYLEFLGAQCASYELSLESKGGSSSIDIKRVKPSVIPVHFLHHHLFSTASSPQDYNFRSHSFDLELTNKMLQIAASWTIEQATLDNIELYRLWFRWYGSQLQPYCNFFRSFMTILEQEKDHPIWNCIVDCWHKVICHNQISSYEQPLRLLSLEEVEAANISTDLEQFHKHLHNAINCVGLLRLTFQQWNEEAGHHFKERKHHLSILQVLKSLRHLEEEVLNFLVESPSFDQLIHVYSKLLDYHRLFWKGITSSQYDLAVTAWGSLKKAALKFQNILPEAVNNLLTESSLHRLSTLSLDNLKPMLWLYGGHPFLPSSAEVYHKMQQLLTFCSSIWPKTWKEAQSENHVLLEAIALTNTELKQLLLQGICLSSYISIEGDSENDDISHQLEEIYQRLLRRFEYDRNNLKMVILSVSEKKNVPRSMSLSNSCCQICPESFWEKRGFESWLETHSLFDRKSFSLDIEILQELSRSILLSPNEVYKVLTSISGLLRYAQDYSLQFSSRQPTEFAPHQKILWLLDAWESNNSVHMKVANIVHEMWFGWHSSLWTYSFGPLKKFLSTSGEESCLLLQPIRMVTVELILGSSCLVMDYEARCLKLRVASGNFWKDGPSGVEFLDCLSSTARSLFEQIIFVHKKSFKDENFRNLRTMFCQLKGNPLTEDRSQTIQSLILSSNHTKLTSLTASFIEPLLHELYSEYPSCDYLTNLGLGWLHIGALRFHLLFEPDGPDPTLKYAFKHSQVLEKISLLQLEIKVRKECENFAGRRLTRNYLERKIESLRKLDSERKRLQEKIVFRDGPANYNSFILECSAFLKSISNCLELARKIQFENMDLQQIVDEVRNWQDTAACFINILTEKHAAYLDIVQPVQVAIYEMKLGLSLVFSSALEKRHLARIGEENMDRISAAVYSLMQFPRMLTSEASSVNPDGFASKFTLKGSDNILDIDFNLLRRLVAISNGNDPVKKVSTVQLQASMHHIFLFRLVCNFWGSLTIDNPCFLLMNEIFGYFANLWMDMKDQVKEKEEGQAQNFRFKPRAVMVEDILEVDVSVLGYTDLNEDLASERGDSLMEQDFFVVRENLKEVNLEEDWNSILESILKNIVLIHNQLFGSSNLVEHPGVLQIIDKDKLRIFMDSYKLGTKIIKGLPIVFPSKIDENLLPEHLLCICLEYEDSLNLGHLPSHVYNIYKESNAQEMSKMVKPLSALQQRVTDLCEEWPDHPGLLKILDVTEMLLALQLSTPLYKGLLGLQFLLNRAHELQENVSRLNLNDELHPIYSLVLTWQKIELNCWPSLLDGVQQQYESNASMLWFPLHSVLHRSISDNADMDNMFTIQSIEEFVQTASVGEFRRRLQLLLAFHGQFNTGIFLKSYSSPRVKDNLDILYNIFGYYIQFLPIILEHIETDRKSLERELKGILKLYHWEEHRDSCLSVDSFKRTRQKSLKLIKKFNDVLQEPVMVILNQKAKGSKFSAWLEQKPCVELNTESVQFPMDLDQYSNIERSLWYGDWKNKVNLAKEHYQTAGFLHTADITTFTRKSLSELFEFEKFQTGWEEGWDSLEMICRSAAEFAHVLKLDTKNLKKRRALVDLLKKLEKVGLSRHKSMISELEPKFNQQGSSFLLPSCDIKHLLLLESTSFNRSDNGPLRNFGKPPDEKRESEWKIANQYYFRNLATMQQLQQICMNFNKDLTLEQVNRAASFLNHLILIQQDQRSVAYGFSQQLQILRKLLCSLERIGTMESSLSSNQHIFFNCMWQQKNLFDNLLSLSRDMLIFLRCVGNSHLSSCDTYMSQADLSSFINRFIPLFLQSKESLDKYLLGSDGVITTSLQCMPHFLISKEMEHNIMQNFQIITGFDECIQALQAVGSSNRSMQDMLLNRFKELASKGLMLMKKTQSELELNSPADFEEDCFSMETLNKHSSAFSQAFGETNKQIIDALEKLCSLCKGHILPEGILAENITSWKDIFEPFIASLHLDLLHDALIKIVIAAGELLNYAGLMKPEVCSQVEIHLKHICVFLDLLLTFGDGILSELVSVHGTVAEMCNMLAHIFASLFSKGFGETEEQMDDTGGGRSQDATGTGLGEGEGLNDVSDQLNDEAQILGSSQKQNEGPDSSDKLPSKDDKGIEMDEDFAAETFSVSEESDNNESEDEQEDINLESVMAENADDGQAAQEKLWDKNDDGCLNDSTEKYEHGSSVKDKDSKSRELRAKDDKDTSMNDNTESDNEYDKESGKDENVGSLDEEEEEEEEEETSDDMLDKSDAFKDPTGIPINDQKDDSDTMEVPDEPQKTSEEADEAQNTGEEMDEPQSPATDEETNTGVDGIEENNLNDGKSSPASDKMEEDDSNENEEKVERNDGGRQTSKETDMNLMGPNKESIDPESNEQNFNPASFTDTAELNVPFPQDSNMLSAIRGPNSGYTCIASGIPSTDVPKMEMAFPDSASDSKLPAGQTKQQSNNISVQRVHANPYRSIGDALKEWKERVEISPESQELETDAPHSMNDENGDEYQFVSNIEKGSSQALGPATSDQVKNNIELNKGDADQDHIEQKEDIDMEFVDGDSEKQSIRMCEASMLKSETDKQFQETVVDYDVCMEESEGNISRNLSEDLVSFKRDFRNENVDPSNFTSSNMDLRRTADVKDLPDDLMNNAIADWRKYELATTNLSQELAEQLRLVMEPTLASKLQGDYKTGKRINMKKVIPYIASHFRKDKIWLRRTKPNKRDYQVVVAVDDSRSMSESHCGNVAIEALVAVCRAMSQLEVGQFAVASFGEKGNIRLLHDFDQPFTGEAGVKMVSSFSFKQDNTIADEPIVDLLKYLNNMLDNAVAKARLPSGNNPLQQLILIIADGRFHEKENLKRYVRDVLSRKRMIAFLLLDSPQESIMDLMEASFQGENLSFAKYMNSFPFPYYVVLRNIEALPRTLADLLRQWFELMQISTNE